MTRITDSVVEAAALDWLDSLGWIVAHGPDSAPDTLAAERADSGQVILEQRLRDTWHHTRVYRISCAWRLNQKRRVKRRVPPAEASPLGGASAAQPNQVGSVDFMRDALGGVHLPCA
ncbi:MAG: hypothetical protein OXB94_09305 [Nitrospira sp.]|nr:hypothetical protein [Nitrospira sp.]